jgi:hypothetical protein
MKRRANAASAKDLDEASQTLYFSAVVEKSKLNKLAQNWNLLSYNQKYPNLKAEIDQF